MSASSALPKSAAYDTVGRYNQDSINGLDDCLLVRMLEAVDPRPNQVILDAMAGDGNLSVRLNSYCKTRGTGWPSLVVLEYSRVQAEFARMTLADMQARVIWGDVLAMQDLENGSILPDETFDRVMIKSANHEICLAKQAELYASIARILKPGGIFVNLGFLFDDVTERDEFRSIARVKDRLAGMESAVVNRHFLTRNELYPLLRDSGFADVTSHETFEYLIRSEIVAQHYFTGDQLDSYDLEHQAAQVKARTMRRKGRIRFEGDSSLMACPGEITAARKATRAESNEKIFNEYPYDFLRSIRAHSEMLTRACGEIPASAKVLDLGCGIGLLAERLVGRTSSYLGLDLSTEFVRICRERYGGQPGFEFAEADMNTFELGSRRYDAISILNALYLPGIDALKVLKRSLEALTPGGCLIVAGPTSPESYRKAEPFIRAQLEQDGLLSGNEWRMDEIGRANDRLLTQRGNYWSAEGMLALLKHVGFSGIRSVETSIYYGYSYMTVAFK